MKKNLIRGVFIDPYRCLIVPIEIRADISVWHRLLACDCLDYAMIGRDVLG